MIWIAVHSCDWATKAYTIETKSNLMNYIWASKHSQRKPDSDSNLVDLTVILFCFGTCNISAVHLSWSLKLTCVPSLPKWTRSAPLSTQPWSTARVWLHSCQTHCTSSRRTWLHNRGRGPPRGTFCPPEQTGRSRSAGLLVEKLNLVHFQCNELRSLLDLEWRSYQLMTLKCPRGRS